ncbi:plasmid mobilization protein [Chroococcidiopsis sp. SAG 2025]|uniref:plasmid mobilization protein n=1 Tax=Chroococcidiopsis sp. SAG 2025 TaxID=171389 RepID=UPI0029374208|nr:ribbon-helix-helix protein, CopG family [Chroococcidiopsis sp. SAG 2025]
MVRIRFTEDEYAAVSQKAIASGLTLSELVRRAALENRCPNPKAKSRSPLTSSWRSWATTSTS